MNKLTCRLLFILMTASMLIITSTQASETVMEKSAFNTGKAILTFGSSPLKAMTEIPFAINIINEAGEQIPDAKLSISMDMPAMPMPPNNPIVQWNDGAYRGKAIFTMAGAWQVTVDIERQEFDQESVVFAIEQVMMK